MEMKKIQKLGNGKIFITIRFLLESNFRFRLKDYFMKKNEIILRKRKTNEQNLLNRVDIKQQKMEG